MTTSPSDDRTLSILAPITDIWGLEVGVIGPGLAALWGRRNGEPRMHHLGSIGLNDPNARHIAIPFEEFYMLRWLSQNAQVPHAFYVEGREGGLMYVQYPAQSVVSFQPIPDPTRGAVVPIPKADFKMVEKKA